MTTLRMVLSRLAPLGFAALMTLAPSAGLRAQDKGKIGDVEHSADNATKGHDDHHDDDDDGGGFFFFLLRGLFHGSHHRDAPVDSGVPAPEPPGQGYLAYPYADRQAPTSFVLRRVTEGRSFANVSGAWFSDDESTLRSLQLAFEAGDGQALLTAEYDFYREPLSDHTDYLHLGHLAMSGIGPIGDIGYFKVGLAVQGVLTDQPRTAGGPGIDVGFQLFPGRPFGLGGSGRFAALTWKGGSLFSTGFADVMGTGSMLIGRAELQAGYRWTRVGVGSPFHGPVVGMRVWF